MGEVVSTSRNFPAVGSEGLARGLRLRNAALTRRMPWGDDWRVVRLGFIYNVETFGITRDSTQPGTRLFCGLCSGPWSIGDHHGRTFRAVGMSLFGGQTISWSSAWNVAVTNGENVWNNTSNNRGAMYYIESASGSYATGGVASTRTTNTWAFMSAGGQGAFPDSTGTPRRTAAIVDIFRQPYGTVWSMRWHCNPVGSTNLALDIPLRTYYVAMGVTASSVNDNWYGLGLTTGTTTAMTAGVFPDVRNAPMDHVDLYWDSYTMGLEIWRFDVRKLS